MALVRYHLPCPLPGCGSSDAYAEDDEGGGYCFSCGRHVKPNGTHTHTHDTKRRLLMPATPIELPALTAKGISSRNISAETMRKFGVGTDASKNLWLPLYHEGQVIGAKVRPFGEKKTFHWEGHRDSKEYVQLWGMQAAQAKWRLIITEGELDALAAYEMFGGKASVVSVPFGAQSAAKYVRKALQWVESFETVYVAMDMDTQGRAASKEIMDLITPGKAREVILPSGYKDACDLSAAGMADTFKEAVYAAQPRIIEGVLNMEHLIEEAVTLYSTPELKVGVSTGYEGLDHLLGGYRQGEVLLIAGGTGSGKSTLTRQLAYNLLFSDSGKLMYIPLEDQPAFSLLDLAQLHMKLDLIHDTPVTPDVLRETLHQVAQNLVVFTRDNINTLEKFVTNLEYAIRMNGVKYVFLDHITLLAEGAEESTVAATNKLMGQVRYLANTYKVTFVVVSHISRSSNDPNDENPTMARLKNASSLGQVPDSVLGVFRVRGTNKTTVKTLKASRTWNKYGLFELTYNYDTTHLEEEQDFGYEEDDYEEEEDEYGTLRHPQGEKQTGSGGSSSEPQSDAEGELRDEETTPASSADIHTRPSNSTSRRRRTSNRNKGLPSQDGQGEASSSAGAVPRETTLHSISDEQQGGRHDENEEHGVGSSAWLPRTGSAFFQGNALPVA